MPASDYAHKPGGSLKLKGAGGAVDPTKKKKKSKSSSSKKLREEDGAGESAGSGKERSESPVVGSSGAGPAGSHKTEAQRRFEEVQRKRV
ncbi:hypothetical protein Rhopal_002757-T1 [Rhodotorula paludigena]|uniref:Uncharacterized protein n=1 Tax=Rhodotorula paludigena TaxID=86838 RepID=A0AAV5GM70_9BASI|nr:hypothetical protein Rhopal_002757-T1 [Rhodotorula paludigena]